MTTHTFIIEYETGSGMKRTTRLHSEQQLTQYELEQAASAMPTGAILTDVRIDTP